jgi:hypothetical protein
MKDRSIHQKPFGFDAEVDFIPFESSDEDNISDSKRSKSRASVATAESTSSPLRKSRSAANEGGRKRKRKDVESSFERSPPAQRQKVVNVTANPWQKDINDYAAYKETAKMYVIKKLLAITLTF